MQAIIEAKVMSIMFFEIEITHENARKIIRLHTIGLYFDACHWDFFCQQSEH